MRKKIEQDYLELIMKGFIWIERDLPKDTNCKTAWECSKGHAFSASYSNLSHGMV